MYIDTARSPLAQANFIDGVKLTGGLLCERARACREALIPHVLEIFDDEHSFFHEVENFRIAAGHKEGEFRGNPFGDGDFYKLLEGMFASGDAALISRAEGYIPLIAAAQRPDGYLSTKQIIAERKGQSARHYDIDDFEEYNFGHLFTCACAYARATGRRDLVEVAEKAARYLLKRCEALYEAKRAPTAVCPSHYMGLIELYRLTGKGEFLRAAELAIALRDYVQNGTDDNQDALPLRKHSKIVGHAVRAAYLYAGAADLYLETGERALLPVLESCLSDLINKKLYINGGCGALYTGASPFGDLIAAKRVHQAFGYAYQLPSTTAYNETCASLGLVFWLARMCAISPRVKYFDIMESCVYNLALAAMSADGRKYFYENMLRRAWSMDDKLMWPLERSDNFECFCCPTNLARFLTQTRALAYMATEDSLVTGLYMDCEADIALENGARFRVKQTTDYPWDGEILLEIDRWNGVPFDLMLRIPEWAELPDAGGFRALRVERAPCAIALKLPLRPRLMIAHDKAEELTGQACVMRGPLLYCAENSDPALSLNAFRLLKDAAFQELQTNIAGIPCVTLTAEALYTTWQNKSPDALYQPLPSHATAPRPLPLIPYFLWDNRGFGEMRTWLNLQLA